MRISLLLAITALCFLVTQAQTITPEDILSIRELSDIQLSPDGKQVAFVITEPAASNTQPRISNIWSMPVDGRESPRPLDPSLINARSPRWSPDGKTLAFLSDRAQIYLLGAGEANAVQLTSVPGGVEDFEWSPDGKTIAFVARDQPTRDEQEKDAIEIDRHLKYSRLWISSVSDRKAVQVTKQDFEIFELAWSPKGDELALVVAPTPKPEDSLNLSLIVVNRSTGEVARTLSKLVNLTGALKWSPDGRLISFYEGPPTKEYASWVSVVPAGGGPSRALLKDYAGSVLRLEWLPDSKHLMAQSVEGTHQVLMTVDVATGDTRKLTDIVHSQWNVGFSTNGTTTAYFSQSVGSPSDIWIFNTDAPPRKITNFNPQTAKWKLGKLREVKWKNSKDGLLRRGVVITPPGYQQGQLYPTIINTHPGDTAWWMGWHGSKWWDWGQLLASNGYVVFLPNTRGVTGEGGRMHQTIADWGGMAFQDLIDGVDYLVAQKIADPNRLGIGG